MTITIVAFAILCGLTLAGVAVSILALYGSRTMAAAARQKVETDLKRRGPALDDMRRRIDGMSEELQELRARPAVTPGNPSPRAGLNLSTRSQALRLYRRGDSAEQIAAALEVPCQEVQLLIKVHRIAMSSV